MPGHVRADQADPREPAARGGRHDDRSTELKPWVRVVVTLYVLTVVPTLLLFIFGLMVMNVPRIFATAYDSFFVQSHKVRHDFERRHALHRGRRRPADR